uniref:Uncharacterized protein n=1 Tax=viral metagenome TaxID=1070528 RepID=A0A6M3IYJ7_9ZZZZ
MSYTRIELRSRARRRVGDPYKGSETTRSGGRILDTDINDSLNDSIHRVATDAVTVNGIPLVTNTAKLAVVQGQRRYQLPVDFVGVRGDRIHFRSSGTIYPLFREDLADLREYVDEDTTAAIPSGYQLYPSSRFLITEGIATGGSATTLEDADRADSSANAFDDGSAVVDSEGSALAANDIVENVTDDSEGAISAITDYDTLTFAAQGEDTGLSGGARNDFRMGDHYRVWSREYTGLELWVAVPASSSDQTTLVSNTDDDDTTEKVVGTNASDQNVKQAQSFKLPRPTVIRSVSLRFGATSDGVSDDSDPIGNIVVRIESDSSGPSGTLADFRAKASRTSITADTWNEFVFDKPFRLAELTTYHLTVEIEAQSTFYSDPTSVYYTVLQDDDANYTGGQRYEYISSWTADSTSDLLFKINGISAEESLEVPYISKGLDLSADTQVMDLPDNALEAVLSWVKYDLMEKAPEGRDRRDRIEALQAYEVAIAKLVQWLTRRFSPSHRQVLDRMGPSPQARQIDPRYPLPLSFGDE